MFTLWNLVLQWLWSLTSLAAIFGGCILIFVVISCQKFDQGKRSCSDALLAITTGSSFLDLYCLLDMEAFHHLYMVRHHYYPNKNDKQTNNSGLHCIVQNHGSTAETLFTQLHQPYQITIAKQEALQWTLHYRTQVSLEEIPGQIVHHRIKESQLNFNLHGRPTHHIIDLVFCRDQQLDLISQYLEWYTIRRMFQRLQQCSLFCQYSPAATSRGLG